MAVLKQVDPIEVTSVKRVTGGVEYLTPDKAPALGNPEAKMGTTAAVFFGLEEPKERDIPKPDDLTKTPGWASYGEDGKMGAPNPEPAPTPPPTPEAKSDDKAGDPPPDPAAEEKPKETPAPETPAAPEPEKKPKRGPVAKLAEATEKLVNAAASLSAQPAPAPAPAPVAPAPAVDPEVAAREAALAYLSESDPRYKGQPLVEQDRKFRVAEQEYRKAWQAKNPDREFDEEDDDHETFYLKNQPRVAERDVIKAEAAVEADARAEQKISQLRAEQARERVDERARLIAEQAPSDFLKEFGVKSVEELAERDPVLASNVEDAMQGIAPVLAEAERLFTPGTSYQPNPGNQAARYLIGVVGQKDAEFAALPAEQVQLPDGRRFAPAEQWARMTREQKQQHWSLVSEPGIVRRLVITSAKQNAEAKAQKFSKFTKATAASVAAVAPPMTPAPPPAPKPAASSNPPSGGAGAPPSPVDKPQANPDEKYWGQYWNS